MHRAPGGMLAYDDRAARALIVGVETKLALKSGFVPGLPSTKFEADTYLGADTYHYLVLLITI